MCESSILDTFSTSSSHEPANNTKTPKMKSMIVFAMVVCVAVAGSIPAGSDADAQVLRYENDNIGVGPFNYGIETSNGIVQEAQGNLKNAGTENEALEIRGSYSHPGPDGVLYTIRYIANEFGFQPEGAHLPVGPQA